MSAVFSLRDRARSASQRNGNTKGTDGQRITLSDGTTATLTTIGRTDFRGFTATQPIAGISIDAPNPNPAQGDNVWAAMDNLIVGSSN
jgi:hypothetical protein